ncbi:MAG: deoxynucleoside kinase [Fibrobacter sp.]|mgnify:CR=1 FL=1|jgi:deoxyadenosine/deoxycytidine kinase|nr:deoxynucleoside kinase [Fibrobacter sp.]
MNLDPSIRFISIEGVIGAGKTSLASILSKKLNATLLEEVFEENPFLEKFYQQPQEYAFQTQLFFLLSRHKQLFDSYIQKDLFRDLIISDYSFDKDKIFALQNLSEDEFYMYEKVLQSLDANILKPDYIIYLQSSVETLLHRIKKRNRPMERYIEGTYLHELQKRYDHHFWHYNDCSVLIINTDKIDFVNNEDHLKQILEVIETWPSQTTYFNPEV